MRALQEKLKILEEENTQLKNSINENNKRENLSLIDVIFLIYNFRILF